VVARDLHAGISVGAEEQPLAGRGEAMRASEQEPDSESPQAPARHRWRLGAWWEAVCSATTRLAVHAAAAAGLYFAVEFAFVHDANPTGLANAAFAITATLAALSFSYARNLDGRPDLQEQAVAGGERLLRGAILMILASLLQYADLYAQSPAGAGEPEPAALLRRVVVHVLHPAATVLFLLAVFSIYLGLRSVVAVLLRRAAADAKGGKAP
jgi:hypothetical protein